MTPSSFPHWNIALDTVPRPLCSAHVTSCVRIYTRLAVIHHQVLAVVALCVLDSEMRGELVAVNDATRTDVGSDEMAQRGSVPVRNFHHEATMLWCPFHTAEHPDAVDSVSSTALPLPELGLIDLHDHARPTNGVMMENHHLPNHLSNRQHPAGCGSGRPSKMVTDKCVGAAADEQPQEMENFIDGNAATHQERPLCNRATETTAMRMHACPPATPHQLFFVG